MMLKKTFIQLAACVALAQMAAVAHADTYQFTLTGDYTANWQLDSSAIPDDYDIGSGIVYWDVTGFPDAAAGVADVYFWVGDFGGGLQINDFYGGDYALVSTEGPQLFTGSEAAPTFKLGTFALTQYLGSGNYTLTVTNLSAVPEPATIAMLLGGLGVVGFTARRRQPK